ncbi:MFS transporter [Spirochaetota bacterium]
MEIYQKGSEDRGIDYSRKWYAMAAVAMGIFLGTIDASIVNIALPTLVKELNTEFSTVQWVVLSYLLTITTLMLGTGRVADIFGKKHIYIWGIAIFTIGSLLCAISPNVYWLIAFRIFQGIGSVMMMALGAGIVSEAFPPSERGKSLGFIGSIVSIGIVAGPVFGGIIINFLSWPWIFLVNLPVGIAGIIISVKFVPSSKPRGGQKFDFAGASFLFISILTLLLALTFGQRVGFANTYIYLLFSVFVVFLGAFIIVQLKVKNPLIDVRLFRRGLLSINFFMGFSSYLTLAGIILLMPFYLGNILGLSPGTMGLMLSVVPICAGIFSPIAGSLSDRYGTWIINAIGLAFIFLSYLVAQTLNENTSIIEYILVFIPLGIGMGTFQSPNNSAIMHSFPRENFGIASSLLAITRTLGQTSGIAVIGAIWAGRVAYYSGEIKKIAPTKAKVMDQVSGIHDVFLVSAVLIFISIFLAIWGYFKSKRNEK